MNVTYWYPISLLFFSTALFALDPEEVRLKLQQELKVEVGEIKTSLLPGFYQAEIAGDLVHISEDGRYVLTGDLLDLKVRKNLTEEYRHQQRVALLSSLPKESLIIFGPEKPNHVVTIFTDIDCGYCRQLHRQIDEYSDKGIQVRYMSIFSIR